MPAVITKTVKTVGGDYTTLALAIAGEVAARANLVGLDQQLDIQVFAGVVDNATVTIDGFTTDATHFVRVIAPAGQGHAGIFDVAKYRIDTSNQNALVINDNFVRIEGNIQVRLSSASGSTLRAITIGSALSAGAYDIRINGVYLKGVGNGSVGFDGFINSTVDDAGGKVYLINCIAEGFHDGAASCTAFNLRSGALSQSVFMYNCTAIRSWRGFQPRSYGRMKNCGAIDCFSAFGGVGQTGHAACTNNGATKKEQASVGANLQQPVSVFMIDPIGGNYQLGPSDTGFKGKGADLSADADFPVTVDVLGNARPGAPTIGCFEPQGAVAQGVRWLRTGGVSATAAQIKARMIQAVETLGVNLKVSTASDLSAPLTFGPVAAPAALNNVATFNVTGLQPNTTYYYGVDTGAASYARQGTFKTFPNGPANFVFATSGDGDTGAADPAFDFIRQAAPLFFLHMGDAHYDDIVVNDITKWRASYELLHLLTPQLNLMLNVAEDYVWDDHDWGGDNSDKTAAGGPAAEDAYRENVPHYALPAGDPGEFPIYHSYVVGRCRFVVTDLRSQRVPHTNPDTSDKTMLGAAQKTWFKNELLAAKNAGQVVFWVCSVPWIDVSVGGDPDSWGAYSTERKELADFMQANQIINLIRLSADAHMVALDDGTNDKYTTDGAGNGHVTVQVAPLRQTGTTKGGPYSHGTFIGSGNEGEGQWALVTVADDLNHTITVTISAKKGNTEILNFAKAYIVPPLAGPPPQGFSVQQVLDGALAFSSANPGVFRSIGAREALERVNAAQQALFIRLAEVNHHRFAVHESLPSSPDASGRTLDLTQLATPLERIVAIRLPTGVDVNVVDITDLSAELAPRAYPLGESLVEVGAEWGAAGPIAVDLWYAYHPADLDLDGSLDQTISIPNRFAQYLEVDLAAYLAHKDFGRAGSDPNEIERLNKKLDGVFNDIVSHITHLTGPESRRFLPTVPTVASKA